jgi:hypothetical protein
VIKRRAQQSQQAIAQIQKNKVRMRIVGYKMMEGTFLKNKILKIFDQAENKNRPEAIDDSILQVRTNFEEI